MSFSEDSNTLNVNTIIVGESCTGKTSIRGKYCNETFDPNIAVTTSCSFLGKDVSIPNSEVTIHLKIWDTSGQEKFRSITKRFFQNAHVVILVYDITNKTSFEEIHNYWYQESINQCPNERIIALIGNKTDLSDRREVSLDEGQRYALKIKAIFAETSAKTGEGIDNVFDKIIRKLAKHNLNIAMSGTSTFTIQDPNIVNNNNGRTCFC